MSVLLIAADQIEYVLYLIEVRFIILSMAGFQRPPFRGDAGPRKAGLADKLLRATLPPADGGNRLKNL
jgi:hypothetical protein